MKRIAVLMAFFLVQSLALSQAQEKDILNSYRVMPKPGKDAALKKAITEHAAKYHTGNWKWRVFSVLSGPDEGTFQINEGPNSWTVLEGRKDISDEHTRDYETNVLPLVERSTPTLYVRFQKEVSSVDSTTGPFKKALLRHVFPKPGKAPRIMSYLSTWRKVWEKMAMKVVVWQSFYSGEPQIIIATRLPQGWVDLEQMKSKNMIEAYDGFAGAGAYDRFVEDNDLYVSKVVDEMIEFLPEASSK
jgi:hypothetical protein